jgi:hypothetical protein
MSADVCSFVIYVLGGFAMGLLLYKAMLTKRWYKLGSEEAVNSLVSAEDKSKHNEGVSYEKWRKKAILRSSVGILFVFLLIVAVFVWQLYF